jgi:hypothetical protein
MNPTMTFGWTLGWTCLHNAAHSNQFGVYQFISENVAKINPETKYCGRKKTPFHFAAMCGNFQICKFIVDGVEDLSPRDKANCTPYDYARQNGHSDICIYIDEVRNQRNGVNLISADESMLKAEGGWPYKSMDKYFPPKHKDPVQSSKSTSCVIS